MARYLLSILLFVLMSASVTLATVVVEMDFNRQARRADLIVIATPLDDTDINWKGYPHTLLKVQVEKFIAGNPAPETIYLLEPGNERLHVAGAVHLQIGRTYLLMLDKVSGHTYRLTGFNQGYYPTRVEKDTGRRVISHKPGGGKSPGMTFDAARKRIIAVRKNAPGNGETE